MIEIYTDGSSRGNPGPGGWGLVVMSENRILLAIGKEHKDDITNNRMELSALVLALELASKTFPTEWTTIYSDSAYCVNICNEWIFNWSRNGWMNSKKQQVENYDLVKKLWNYIEFPQGRWTIRKCSGHNGVIGNEIADALATNNKEKLLKILTENNLEYDEKKIFENL